MNLPDLALAVRQPWAWAIFHADPIKDIENRDWRKPNPGLDFRGRCAIHASSGMTQKEYEHARDAMKDIGAVCPPPAQLRRGGIIGVVKVADIVKASDSPWFFGPRGLVLRDPEPCEFIPVSGVLGFFQWRLRTGAPIPPPARWMLPKSEVVGVTEQEEMKL